MSVCNVPKHKQLLTMKKKFAHFWKTKKKYELPKWTTLKSGEPPRELVLSVYCKGEREAEFVLRPCRGCWYQIIYKALGLDPEQLKVVAPEFVAYIPDPPKVLSRKEWRMAKRYYRLRPLVYMILDEVREAEKNK